jgi:hypothetical protein
MAEIENAGSTDNWQSILQELSSAAQGIKEHPDFTRAFLAVGAALDHIHQRQEQYFAVLIRRTEHLESASGARKRRRVSFLDAECSEHHEKQVNLGSLVDDSGQMIPQGSAFLAQHGHVTYS